VQNLLYYGDNLDVLRRHVRDETVDLCYIDPPFNSKRNYNQIYNNIGHEDRAQAQAFVDTWTWDDHANDCFGQILTNVNNVQTRQSIELIHGLDAVLGRGSLFAYLVSMTVRIAEIRRVLKTTGSFYLHCDPTASHYLKLICDAIFVPQGGEYKNEIAWARTNAHNIAAKYYARVQDTIFFYTKSDKYTWNPPYTDFSPQQLKRYFPDPDTGRLVTGQDLTMTGNAHKNFTWRGTTPPPHRGWGFSLEQLEELWKQGLILKKQDGTPRLDGRKVFLDEKLGKPLGSVWTDIERIGNTSSERLGYPTQKPEALLERIINASSNKGDTVLDAYCGCGTTTFVAQGLKRRWIGIDITYQSISLVLRRLEKVFGEGVLNHITLDGIPRDMESAVALAHKKDDRVRKEFEKWAILTYTINRAIINDKKGADRGIDGTAYFMTTKKDNAKIVFQVKSGGVKRGDVATLRGDMEREKAVMAVLITLEKPSHAMIEDAKAAGTYHHEMMGRSYDKIQIVTVKEIIEQDKRLDVPTSLEVLRVERRAATDSQLDLEYSAA
jgi:site-specific DNA-methyltransferase (adenine-specific)